VFSPIFPLALSSAAESYKQGSLLTDVMTDRLCSIPLAFRRRTSRVDLEEDEKGSEDRFVM